MRTMRPYSRITMVRKPIQRIVAREKFAEALDAALDSSMIASILDQLHEHLLEPIDLVAHALHFDAERREAFEQLIERLLFRDVDLERVLIDAPQQITGERRRCLERCASVEYEGLGGRPALQNSHAVAFDHVTAVDDRDV